MTREISFIINPKAGSFSIKLVERIRERFPEATLHFTEAASDGVRLASELSASGKVLVACGGDGTLREVVEGAKEGVTLAFIPLGTLNLVSRHLGIPTTHDGVLELIEKGEAKKIYPGLIKTPEYTKPFLLAISAGPDADAVHMVSLRLKKIISRFAYAVSFIKRMVKPVVDEIDLVVDGKGVSVGTATLLRGPFYGGVFRFGKKATLENVGVEALATGEGRIALLRLYLSVLTGGFIGKGGALRFFAKEVAFKNPSGRIQIDGDPDTAYSASVYTAERPITVICGDIK